MAQSAGKEIVVKIGDEVGNGSGSVQWNKELSDAKSRQQSSYSKEGGGGGGGGIGDCREEDDDDDDDDEVMESNASFPRHSLMPITHSKSRLDDRHWQYERAAKTGNRGENDDSFLDEDFLEEIDWKKFKTFTVVQWVSLVLILVTLACTLSVAELKKQTLWDLPLWKWEVLILVLICGHLVSGWIIRICVFFVERKFLRKIRVLYFVYGLRKSIQNCLWLGLVLIVWLNILAESIGRETNSGVLRYVTKILVCLLVGTVIWLLKTLIVKLLASSFHVSAFFDRIRVSLFKQHAIKKLSGPRIVEEQSEQEEERVVDEAKKNPLLTRISNSKMQNERITIERLHKLNRKNVSAMRMKRLISIVQSGVLNTLDDQLSKSSDEDESSLRIRDECEAKAAAKKIFKNVAPTGSKYIYLEDLRHFMSEEDALKIMHLFEGSSEGSIKNQGISKRFLTKWVVDALKERRSLALSLDDTKTAVDELHNMLDVVVAIIIVIIWLFIFGLAITHFIVFASSQLLLVVFVFGNTCKTIFEAIIFLFVMHPYDVGDRCEVDGVQMIVEEMNILTTVFQRYDNQIIIYPNSILATKPIGNYFRSPDMADTVDFSIHISTPMEKIAIMKKRIIRYIESRSDHWHQTPTVNIRELEDMNRLKMVVCVTHRMNHHKMVERWSRRTLLVEEMIKVFRELDIEYRMLPLDMNVRNMPVLTSNTLPSNWTTCAGM
uniref:Mechanosensitive ion channel protein n=1 Tax=Davidia involucrata TaxID=16924 RepID=A0A5B7BL62_DAVIN